MEAGMKEGLINIPIVAVVALRMISAPATTERRFRANAISAAT
jgi:hypothetical protein